jgi:hypothetical protein
VRAIPRGSQGTHGPLVHRFKLKWIRDTGGFAVSRLSSSPMRRGMPWVAALVALAIPTTATASSGTITNPSANSTWTTGAVANLSVTFDQCGSPDVDAHCTWAGRALLISQAEGGCPADSTAVQEAATGSQFWEKGGPYSLGPSPILPGYQEPFYSNGTVESGPLSLDLKPYRNRPARDTICLYLQYAHLYTPSCQPASCTSVSEPVLVASQALVARPAPPKCPKGKRRVRRHGKFRCVPRRHQTHPSHHAA